jgi:hypothetical protein
MDQVRYDSIWRRIKSDDYASKLEGQFRESRNRLAALNNWGSLAWLYPHATATKLAHHYGVEHNACHFLEADPVRHKYRPSFRIASHVLHWGHLPLSYAGLEGILRATHIDENARKVLENVLADVEKFGSLDCDADHGDQCSKAVIGADRPFELYRWLSAWLVSKRWKKIWSAVKSLAPPESAEQSVKEEVVRTLVCRQSFGYQLLDLCRLADYVPRDLLQAGTAWLTVDIEVLWETSPLRPDRAQEWNLLEASRDYLEDRFFVSPEALLIHSLASRVIAQGILNQGFNRDHLLAMLTNGEGDAYYLTKFADYHRRRLGRVKRWAEGESLARIWEHVGTFEGVAVPPGSRFDIEAEFTKRSSSGQLSYPLTGNFSVVIEPRGGTFFERGEAPNLKVAALQLHYRTDDPSKKARPVLDIALRAFQRQGEARRDDVAEGISSWLLKSRVDVRCRGVRNAAGSIFQEELLELQPQINRIREQAVFRSGRYPRRWRRQIERLRFASPQQVARAALEMPLGAMKTKDGEALLQRLKSRAIDAVEQKSAIAGFALEAAVAVDQLLSSEPCVDRFLILGATALSEEGKPTAEWDVLRLDLLAKGDWRLVATECAVSRNNQKDEAEREKLERLRLCLQGRFSDLVEYRTRLATVNGGALVYEDGARGFVRT